jgi:hypothetical protein
MCSPSPFGIIGRKFVSNYWKGLTNRDQPDVSRFPNPMAVSGISAFRRSQVKAHLCSQPSGFVEIVHPFHPLFRQQFALLKSRTVLGVECVILKGSPSGTFSVPKNWTSTRVNDHYEDAGVPPTILRLEHLIELARLVDRLSKSGSS